MNYQIIWTREAQNDLNKLQREIILRIVAKVEATKDNPIRYLKKLVNKKEWSLRVGDYRLLITLDQNNEELKVLKIGHRKHIYD